MDETSQILIGLGFLLLIGLAADSIGKLTPLPRVSLLMLFGFIAGHNVFDLLPAQVHNWFTLLTDMALSMVAFLLGGRLSARFMRLHGTTVVGLSIVITLITFVFVILGLKLFGLSWETALILAAIATATAPAAVTDVVRELKAKGPFSATLLGVVAVDDIWGIILFSIVLAFAQMLSGSGGSIQALEQGGFDLIGAIALGSALGLPMALLTGRIHQGDPTISEAIGMIFLCGGLARWLDVSFLLAAMTMGIVIVNLAKHHNRPFHAIENIEWPFLSLFFILAGASFEPDSLAVVTWATLVYILSRTLGRLLGSKIGAKMVGLPKRHAQPMGLALMPQAGVALGMALVASEDLPTMKEQVLPLVIAATVIFELLGPILTRFAIVYVKEDNR